MGELLVTFPEPRLRRTNRQTLPLSGQFRPGEEKDVRYKLGILGNRQDNGLHLYLETHPLLEPLSGQDSRTSQTPGDNFFCGVTKALLGGGLRLGF